MQPINRGIYFIAKGTALEFLNYVEHTTLRYIGPGMKIPDTKKSVLEYTAVNRNHRTSARAMLDAIGVSGQLLRKPMINVTYSQLAKILVVRALVTNPNMIILDRPEMYLELDHIIWLYNIIVLFQGIVILLTNDLAVADLLSDYIVICSSSDGSLLSDSSDDGIEIMKMNYSKYLSNKEIARKSMKAAGNFVSWPSWRPHIYKFTQPKPTAEAIYTIDNCVISYYSTVTIKRLQIYHRDRIFLYGSKESINTLMKFFAMEIEQISGEYSIKESAKIGFYSAAEADRIPKALSPAVFLQNYHNVRDYEVAEVLLMLGLNMVQMYKPLKKLDNTASAKTLLAAMIISRPEILVLDDPTKYLSLRETMSFIAFINNLNSAVIITTNCISLVEECSFSLYCVGNSEIIYKAEPGSYSCWNIKKPMNWD